MSWIQAVEQRHTTKKNHSDADGDFFCCEFHLYNFFFSIEQSNKKTITFLLIQAAFWMIWCVRLCVYVCVCTLIVVIFVAPYLLAWSALSRTIHIQQTEGIWKWHGVCAQLVILVHVINASIVISEREAFMEIFLSYLSLSLHIIQSTRTELVHIIFYIL